MEIRTWTTPSKTLNNIWLVKMTHCIVSGDFLWSKPFLNVRLKSVLPLHYSDFHLVSFLTENFYNSLSGIQTNKLEILPVQEFLMVHNIGSNHHRIEFKHFYQYFIETPAYIFPPQLFNVHYRMTCLA